MLGRIREKLLVLRQQRDQIASIGVGARIEASAQFEHHGGIRLGKYCRIGPRCVINGEGGVEVGDGTILGPGVVIYSSTHVYRDCAFLPYGAEDELRPVKIGRGVWLGHGVMIAPGTTVGDGVVAGMGSLLSGVIEAGSIVVGNPFRIVARRDAAVLSGLLEDEAWYIKESAAKGFSRRKVVDGAVG